MIRPICANCKKELVCEKNEIPVVHYVNNDKAQGIDAVRFGDLWKCNECNSRMVFGMGRQILGHDIKQPKLIEHIMKNGIEIKR